MPGFLAPKTLTGNGKGYLAPARAPALPPDDGGSAYATHILEVFDSRAGVARANLAGMRWYVFAQVAPTPLGAPIAQGIAEATDGAGAALFDITGQTSVLPGANVTLGFTNSNGDPDQAGLISWFGTVRAL